VTTGTEQRVDTRGPFGRLASNFSALGGFNIRVYLAGSALSLIGSYAQMFAQWWLVLSLTDNKAVLPIMVGLQTLPVLLFGPWGGSIVDRFDNRRLLTLTTLLNTAASVLLGALVATGHVTVFTVYVFGVLVGCISAVERPALQAILSQYARPDEIPSAVGLNSMLNPIARLAGPPIASVLIGTIGIAWCFYVNGVSFLLFLAMLLLTKRSEMLPRRQTARGKGAVRDGFHYARHHPTVGPALLAMFVVGFAGFNFAMILPLMGKYTFHVDERHLSLVFSMSAVGSLLGGALVAGVKHPTMRRIGAVGIVFGLLLVSAGASPNYFWWVATSALVGFAGVAFPTLVVSLLQQKSSPEMLGRVMALYGVAFFGTTPFGAAFVAWLTSAFSARAGFLMGGAIVALTGLVTLVLYRATDSP
jgi:MFS family permease